MTSCRVAAVILFGVTIASSHGGVAAQPATQPASPPPARVLMLYSHDRNAPAVAAFTEELHAVVRSSSSRIVEFYDELLDMDRFPDRDRWPQLRRNVIEKYGDLAFDAIVVEGARGLGFVVENLRAVFPGVPVVYGLAFEPVLDFDALPPDVVGRRQTLPFAATLELARRLQPDAERVVVVGGSSANDSLLLGIAIEQLMPLRQGLPLVPLQNWSHPELLDTLRRLPARSIVILSSFRRDRHGVEFNSGDLIASLTTVAAAPVYGISHNWIGDGVVGGGVMFGDDGREVGRMLLGVLDRAESEPLPRSEVAPNRLLADWRQLQRWGLDERRLPADTELLFKPPTLWQRYRVGLLAIAVVIVAQSLLIGLLLIERAKRIQAQQRAEQSQSQATHLARVAVVGELAAAVSHELRQPLSAIRTHAETGAMLLSQDRPDVEVAREIFDEIVQDDLRAADVIDHVRLLLRKDAPSRETVDLNAVCARATRLLAHEAHNRRARIELSLDPRRPLATGDEVQLQQVVLNLAFNALDAVTTMAADRKVTVGTTVASGATGEVSVFITDTGPGVPADVQPHLFEPFFSTKAHGLGMGLAIVRLIVERHEGRVVAGNDPAGGAVFRVLLPAA